MTLISDRVLTSLLPAVDYLLCIKKKRDDVLAVRALQHWLPTTQSLSEGPQLEALLTHHYSASLYSALPENSTLSSIFLRHLQMSGSGGAHVKDNIYGTAPTAAVMQDLHCEPYCKLSATTRLCVCVCVSTHQDCKTLLFFFFLTPSGQRWQNTAVTPRWNVCVCVCVCVLNENTDYCPVVPRGAQTVIRLLIRWHAEDGVLAGLE